MVSLLGLLPAHCIPLFFYTATEVVTDDATKLKLIKRYHDDLIFGGHTAENTKLAEQVKE
jgi:hypothetical protein